MIDPRSWIDGFEIAPAKLTAYLLTLQHEDGGSKAAFFLARGFTEDKPEDLEYVLKEHGRVGELDAVTTDRHGSIFSVRGGVLTPLNRTMHVTTVWAVRISAPAIAHLVTAYPGNRF